MKATAASEGGSEREKKTKIARLYCGCLTRNAGGGQENTEEQRAKKKIYFFSFFVRRRRAKCTRRASSVDSKRRTIAPKQIIYACAEREARKERRVSRDGRRMLDA